VASPIWVLQSRQQRPLFQDDELSRGEFAPRGLGDRVIAVIGKATAYRGSTRMNADQDEIGKPGKNAVQDADCTD
jgi:hypothetical protein